MRRETVQPPGSTSSAKAGTTSRSPRAGRRLPPLNLFRAFDAAVRHLSFTAAADELLVTQSAVSQQIRQLEEFLDVRLFRRLPRGLELTREGTALAGTVVEALNMMARACGKLADPEAPTVLCLNASPAFASKWLAPRLKHFMEVHPNIRVTLLSSTDPVSFNRQDIDVAIRWGRGHWEGAHAELIAREPILGLCSPSLAEPGSDGFVLRDIGEHTLLQVINQPGWTVWLEQQGVSGSAFKDTLYF
ncbi:MAG: LysR family transcriptional regulator, partial [Parvibaculaceae bacterium]